jgi:Lrp/AsnC family leucine-responsive transcriptional regulator
LNGRNFVKTTTLDEVDFRIINALVQNGRASFASLGELVGLSPHGAADRVRRLRAAGVITGFTAGVDLESVGRSLDAVIDLQLSASSTPESFEERVAELPAVREVAFVTGRFDYQVRVACRDADDLDRTVRTLRRLGAGQTETRIVLRSMVHRPDVNPAQPGDARGRTGP